MKRSLRRELYQPARRKAEQALEESNPPQEGGLDEASWLAPGASSSYRTYPFLSEPNKPNSPSRVGFVPRDVFGRLWTLTTHQMHDRPVSTGVAQRPSLFQTFLAWGNTNRSGVNLYRGVHRDPLPRGGRALPPPSLGVCLTPLYRAQQTGTSNTSPSGDFE